MKSLNVKHEHFQSRRLQNFACPEVLVEFQRFVGALTTVESSMILSLCQTIRLPSDTSFTFESLGNQIA